MTDYSASNSGADVLWSVTDGIGRITLNRPDKSNAVNLDFGDALARAVDACAADKTARVLLVEAKGGNFSAGGDVEPLAGDRDTADRLAVDITDRLHHAMATIVGLSIPVIVAVQGYTVGGALGLVCAADLVIASKSAKFMAAFGRIGLATDCGVGYLLPRLVGARAALDLVLTNRLVDADEALRIGIASRVVPDAELANTARELARSLADGPRQAHAATKQLVYNSSSISFLEHLSREQSTLCAKRARLATSYRGYSVNRPQACSIHSPNCRRNGRW